MLNGQWVLPRGTDNTFVLVKLVRKLVWDVWHIGSLSVPIIAPNKLFANNAYKYKRDILFKFKHSKHLFLQSIYFVEGISGYILVKRYAIV